MNKPMNIPQEFEEYLQGVELTEDEIGLLNWIVGWDCRTVKNLQSVLRKVREIATLEASAIPLSNEPLTQADVDKMHFDRVWIDYGTGDCSERDGEEGVILYGKLYSIDTLDGAGLEDLLLDATGHGADTLDNPSGNYTVYRRPPEEEWNESLTLDELREMVGCWVWVIVTYQHEGKTFQCDGWALVETPARIAYLDQEFQLTELGTRFHVYRHQVSDFRVRFAPNKP